jgi:hypothetical protein
MTEMPPVLHNSSKKEVALLKAMEALWVSGGIAPLFLNLVTRRE